MDYHEATAFLFGLRRFRPSPGTESTRAFLEHLGNPHESVEFVQVAGSNGKGSTAKMLESTLRETDRTVGLFTSPHLEEVRERIRVDGRKIPKSAVREFGERTHEYVTEQAAAGDSPTFFEAMTALALWHFGRTDVDVGVLEVGIGGRYDATSVVDPVTSAVTSVSLEHTDVIGETVEEIAEDKAQVAPDGRPLVTGTTGAALETVRAIADEVRTVGVTDAETEHQPDVVVHYAGRVNHAEAAITIEADDWAVDTRLPVLGEHQAENAGIAATLARQFPDVSTDDIATGLRNAHWPGRFEVMETDPLVVLDGAHNPDACARLTETLSTFTYGDLHLVFGAMHDKDHREMVDALPTPDVVYACEPALDRAEDSDVLARVFRDRGVPADAVRSAGDVPTTLETALEAAEPDDCILVAGSLFGVAEARRRWTRTPIRKAVRDAPAADAVLDGVGGSGGRHGSDGRRSRWLASGGASGKTPRDRARSSAVHRVLKLSLSPQQAPVVERELVRAGGDCLTGPRIDGEPVDAVLTGTVAEFTRLAASLEGRPHGLTTVAQTVRDALGLAEAGESASDAGVTTKTETSYPWSDGPCVMGILNVTPDSFHDGGEYARLEDAVSRAEAMVQGGAGIVDVGGESTRPGADPISVQDEIDRVVPVVERLAELDAAISIDTRRAAVAEAALEAGADIINDVSGLDDPAMRFLAADHDVPVVLMHSIDAPVVPDRSVEYDDVVEDVIDQLAERILLAEKAGLEREQIVVDPGLGFGKSPAESFDLLGRLDELRGLGCPILVGHSHKSMFEHVGCAHGERLEPTVAATALAVDRGADVVRVHDVPENVAAVKTALATTGGAVDRDA